MVTHDDGSSTPTMASLDDLHGDADARVTDFFALQQVRGARLDPGWMVCPQSLTGNAFVVAQVWAHAVQPNGGRVCAPGEGEQGILCSLERATSALLRSLRSGLHCICVLFRSVIESGFSEGKVERDGRAPVSPDSENGRRTLRVRRRSQEGDEPAAREPALRSQASSDALEPLETPTLPHARPSAAAHDCWDSAPAPRHS